MLKFTLAIAMSLIFLQSTMYSTTDFYKGIDISYYQGEVNFKELSSSGIKYLYIRAGEGENIVDSRFEENYKNAESQDLNYGFYYYVTAKNTTQAESQAEHFSSLISGLAYSLRPAMDFEEFTDISIEESNEIALSFLKKLEELTKVTPVIYTDTYCVESRWSSELADYPLWVADYAHLAEPQNYSLPENSIWTQWTAYQYSDSATFSGIDGNVDADIFTSGLIITKADENTDQKTTETFTGISLSYTIKTGDTLWEISQKFQSSVTSLGEENDITNVNLIFPGETLKIPMKVTYTVEYGDTLSEIATKFHTTVEILSEINQIKDINLIYTGETLYIP